MMLQWCALVNDFCACNSSGDILLVYFQGMEQDLILISHTYRSKKMGDWRRTSGSQCFWGTICDTMITGYLPGKDKSSWLDVGRDVVGKSGTAVFACAPWQFRSDLYRLKCSVAYWAWDLKTVLYRGFGWMSYNVSCSHESLGRYVLLGWKVNIQNPIKSMQIPSFFLFKLCMQPNKGLSVPTLSMSTK